MIVKKEIEIPIYRGIFAVIFANENVKISDHYDDRLNQYILEYAHFFPVTHKESNKQVFLIAFNTNHKSAKLNHGVIAHEVFHAVAALLYERDINLADESEEAYSYLIQWMTDFVYDVIKDYNIEVSNKL